MAYNVQAGGGYDASSAGLRDRFDGSGCVGRTTPQPTFILQVTGRIPRLTIRAESGGDTAIMINTASGHWRCNDDTNGNNPSVTMQNTTPGQYDIWVTSYDGSSLPSRLIISR